MSTHIHTALQHRVSLPAWLIASFAAVVLALAVIAIADAGGGAAPASASSGITQPTSCVDSAVVGHC